MEALPENKYRIIAPDLRGFGGSSYHMPISSVKDFAKDLSEFADALDLTKFALMGWSLGSLIALQFAADFNSRVTKLALLGASAYSIPSAKHDDEGKEMSGHFWSSREDMVVKYAGIRKILTEHDFDKLRKGLNQAVYLVNKPSPDRYQNYLKEIFRQRNKLDTDYATVQFNISHEYNGIAQGTGEIDKIICPTLVFQGDKDIVVPIAYGQKLAEEIGENAKFILLSDTSHSPLVDSLDQVIQELNDFILEEN